MTTKTFFPPYLNPDCDLEYTLPFSKMMQTESKPIDHEYTAIVSPP